MGDYEYKLIRKSLDMSLIESAVEKAYTKAVSLFEKKVKRKASWIELSWLKYLIQDNCQDLSDNCNGGLDQTIKKVRRQKAKKKENGNG